jgi:hypothetical protein
LQQSTPPDRWKTLPFCSRQIDFCRPSRDTLLCGRLSCKISEAWRRRSLPFWFDNNYWRELCNALLSGWQWQA